MEKSVLKNSEQKDPDQTEDNLPQQGKCDLENFKEFRRIELSQQRKIAFKKPNKWRLK